MDIPICKNEFSNCLYLQSEVVHGERWYYCQYRGLESPLLGHCPPHDKLRIIPSPDWCPRQQNIKCIDECGRHICIYLEVEKKKKHFITRCVHPSLYMGIAEKINERHYLDEEPEMYVDTKAPIWCPLRSEEALKDMDNSIRKKMQESYWKL